MFNNRDKSQKKDSTKATANKQRTKPGACLRVKAFNDLLHLESYAHILEKLRQTAVYLPEDAFDCCYKQLIENYFAYCQALPELGKSTLAGLFHQGLLRAYSMQLATHEYYQQDDHAGDPMQALARYIAFSAGLVMDISQVYTHSQVVLCNAKGKSEGLWNPFAGSLQQHAADGFYKIYHCESPLLNRSTELSLLLARSCMPAVGMEWIAKDQVMLGEWIKLIAREQGLLGPFAYALQHYQRFMIGIELPADWLESSFIAEFELGEDFFRWLQQLSENDVGDLGESIQNSEDGVAIDVEELAKAFEKTPQGRILAETHGGTIALHAAVATQFRDLFPFGVDAVIKSKGARAGAGFSGSQQQKHCVVLPKEMLKSEKTIPANLKLEKSASAASQSLPVITTSNQSSNLRQNAKPTGKL